MKEGHERLFLVCLAGLICFMQSAQAFDGNVASIPAKFLSQGFGGLEIGGLVLLFVIGAALYKMGAPLAGILPVMTLTSWALWNSIGGIFEPLWMLMLMVSAGVVPLGIWRSVNK